jgi:hypothetical protein
MEDQVQLLLAGRQEGEDQAETPKPSNLLSITESIAS